VFIPEQEFTTRTINFNGREEEFSLFRCKLTDNTRRWCISIVPLTFHPGTMEDIDFYVADTFSNNNGDQLPPRSNWMTIPRNGGALPPPQVYPRFIHS